MLVHNQFGVLNRVTSMFRRRQFNICSLAVSETESDAYSRITIQSEGDEIKKEQLINQLYKLPDVCSVGELDPLETVSRELLLIKVRNDPAARGDIRSASDAYSFSLPFSLYTKKKEGLHSQVRHPSDGGLAPLEGDDAGAGDLHDLKLPHEFDEVVDLPVVAHHLNDDGVLGVVHHLALVGKKR